LLSQQTYLVTKPQQFAQLLAWQGTASLSERLRMAILGSLLARLIQLCLQGEDFLAQSGFGPPLNQPRSSCARDQQDAEYNESQPCDSHDVPFSF
jgi:hypothetical protein